MKLPQLDFRRHKSTTAKARLLPPWPVIEIRATASNLTAVMHGAGDRPLGAPIQRNYDASATMGPAGVNVSMELAKAQGLRWCRVRAFDVNGLQTDLAINVAGHRFETLGKDGTVLMQVESSGTGAGNRLGRAPRWVGFAAIGGFVVVLSGMVWLLTSLLASPDITAEQGPAVTQTAPAQAQLPVHAPAGFDTLASWSIPVPKFSGQVLTTGTGAEQVLWYADGSAVVRIKAATGERLSTTETGMNVQKLVRTDLGQGTVIAAYDGRTKVLGLTTEGAKGPLVEFKEATVVSFGGDRPLASSVRSATVWTVDNAAAPAARLVPAGAKALASMGGRVLSVDSRTGQLWWIASDSVKFPAPQKLALPAGMAALTGVGAVVDGYWVAEFRAGSATDYSSPVKVAAAPLSAGSLGPWTNPVQGSVGAGTQIAAGDGAHGNLFCFLDTAWNTSTGAALTRPTELPYRGAGCATGSWLLTAGAGTLSVDESGAQAAAGVWDQATPRPLTGTSTGNGIVAYSQAGNGTTLYSLTPKGQTK